MWMMEMIYTRNGMAWGNNGRFHLQRFMGWQNWETRLIDGQRKEGPARFGKAGNEQSD
jgi:hypothetical protein